MWQVCDKWLVNLCKMMHTRPRNKCHTHFTMTMLHNYYKKIFAKVPVHFCIVYYIILVGCGDWQGESYGEGNNLEGWCHLAEWWRTTSLRGGTSHRFYGWKEGMVGEGKETQSGWSCRCVIPSRLVAKRILVGGEAHRPRPIVGVAYTWREESSHKQYTSTPLGWTVGQWCKMMFHNLMWQCCKMYVTML